MTYDTEDAGKTIAFSHRLFQREKPELVVNIEIGSADKSSGETKAGRKRKSPQDSSAPAAAPKSTSSVTMISSGHIASSAPNNSGTGSGNSSMLSSLYGSQFGNFGGTSTSMMDTQQQLALAQSRMNAVRNLALQQDRQVTAAAAFGMDPALRRTMLSAASAAAQPGTSPLLQMDHNPYAGLSGMMPMSLSDPVGFSSNSHLGGREQQQQQHSNQQQSRSFGTGTQGQENNTGGTDSTEEELRNLMMHQRQR